MKSDYSKKSSKLNNGQIPNPSHQQSNDQRNNSQLSSNQEGGIQGYSMNSDVYLKGIEDPNGYSHSTGIYSYDQNILRNHRKNQNTNQNQRQNQQYNPSFKQTNYIPNTSRNYNPNMNISNNLNIPYVQSESTI